MLSEMEPNSTVTGGPISGTDPQALETIANVMNKVQEYVQRQTNVSLKDLVIFMKQIGVDNFKEEDFERIIQGMIFDQRIEVTNEGYYKSVTYEMFNRIVYTETPCAHCPLARMCSATDEKAVVNPNRCQYLQQWEMEF